MKILIKFNNEYVCFYDYSDFKDNDLAKTNILDYNDIALSDSFIIENYHFVVDFIKKNILKRHINKVYIDKVKLSETVLAIINNVQNLKYIYINEEKKVDINIFSYVLNNKNINTLNCYDINTVTFERLNFSRNLKIVTRKHICDDSYLYRINNIFTYSDLFYSDKITIDKQMNKTDLKNIEKYLKINFHVKNIIFKYFNDKDINSILSLIEKNNKKYITLNIIENDSNVKKILNNIDSIKKKNKKILKKHNIKLKVVYEEKYIKANRLPQLNLNYLKTMLLSIIFFVSIGLLLSYVVNKKKTNETTNLSNKINNIVNNINNDEIIKKQKQDEEQRKKELEEEKKKKEESDIKTEKPKQESAYFKNYSKAITELKKINNDTVGWLTINNSTINYPVVKTNNNDKYLNYSFDNKRNLNGWIFMDYRNNPKDLDRNTIIYGHSGNYYVMFGSLHKVLNKSWYSNKNNQIITFNTENENIRWQIFSIYTIPDTSDYLYNTFENDAAYLEFLNMIKGRSINNFGVELNTNDKILTLSTCYKDSSKRLVIHAKKM